MSEERDFETEARSEGWVPESEWQGDPKEWRDAETFVKKGEEILPIVNARLRKERERVSDLEKRLDTLDQSSREFREMASKGLEKERKEKQALIAELEARREQAVTDSDGKTFTRVDKQITELRSDLSKPNGQERQNQLSPEARAWLDANAWYSTDEEKAAMADGFAERLAKRGLPPDEFYKALDEKLQKAFEKMGNPNRQQSKVETDGTKRTKTGSRTYEALPDDAKQACDHFEKTMPGFKREDYLKHYDWSE